MKYTQEYIIDYINTNHPGTKILKIEGEGCFGKLQLICGNGHKSNRTFFNVMRGGWCNKGFCNKRLFKFNEVEDFLYDLHPGCKILSKQYINNEKLKIKCKNNHIFEMSLHSIKNKSWCKDCQDIKEYDINSVKDYINENHMGSILLDETYKSVKINLNIICEKGHKFNLPYSRIMIGKWCQKCKPVNVKHNLAYAENFIKKKYPKAKLLSTIYKNNKTKLNIICENNHNFEMSLSSIGRGYWCKYCKSYKMEEITRQIFEQLFDKPFIKVRIPFLKTWFELDGYNSELNTAFEYNGEQHYKKVKCFKINTKKLAKIQKHDLMKKTYCEENNIKLIIIKPSEGINDILEQLKQLGYNVENIDFDKIKMYGFYVEKKYNMMKDIVDKKGGKLLTKNFLTDRSEVFCECEKGHIFKTNYKSLKRHWCMECHKEKWNITKKV